MSATKIPAAEVNAAPGVLPTEPGHYWFGFNMSFVARERGVKTWSLIEVTRPERDMLYGTIKAGRLHVGPNPLENYVRWKVGRGPKSDAETWAAAGVEFVKVEPPAWAPGERRDGQRDV